MKSDFFYIVCLWRGGVCDFKMMFSYGNEEEEKGINGFKIIFLCKNFKCLIEI